MNETLDKFGIKDIQLEKEPEEQPKKRGRPRGYKRNPESIAKQKATRTKNKDEKKCLINDQMGQR